MADRTRPMFRCTMRLMSDKFVSVLLFAAAHAPRTFDTIRPASSRSTIPASFDALFRASSDPNDTRPSATFNSCSFPVLMPAIDPPA